MFGAALDEGMTARHVCARTVEELAPMRGSKYVQSDLGGSFSQVKALLEEGTAVLFSGVPCQVDGLKRYLGKDYPNLLTCDLVCHGVPSPAVFRAYLDGLEAARAIRALPRPDAQTIPILAMSANAFSDDIRQSLAAGMNDHLSKPIDERKLLAAMARLLGKDEKAVR